MKIQYFYILKANVRVLLLDKNSPIIYNGLMASALAERPILAEEAPSQEVSLGEGAPVRRDVVPSGPVLPPIQPPTDGEDFHAEGENPYTIKQKL